MTAPVDPKLLAHAVRLTREGRRNLMEELLDSVDVALIPNERVDIVDWCQEKVFVPTSVSERSGLIVFSPVQAAIMRLMQQAGVEQITFLKVPRFGSTLMNSAAILYFAVNEGWPIIFYERSEGDAQDFHDKVLFLIMQASTDVAKMIRPDTKTGIQDAWMDRVLTNGAPIQLRSVSNNGSFRAIKGRFICTDETSAKEYRDRSKNAEGSKLALIRKRQQQYADPILYVGGTPTRVGECTVSEEYERSNRMTYVMPCPGCLEEIEFKPDVRQAFEYDARTGAGLRYMLDAARLPCRVWYECDCGEKIPETSKIPMMEAGRLRANAIGEKGHFGVYVWAAYSTDPRSTWLHIAAEHVKAMADPAELMQPFVNLVLGRPWDPSPVAKVQATELESRAEEWLASVPSWVIALFCGIDVQEGSWSDITKPPRIELTVMGVGPNQRRYVITHETIAHVDVVDPLTGEVDRRFVPPFREGSAEMLWEILEKDWATEDGRKLRIRRTFVDSGYAPMDVHRFVAHPRTRALNNVVPIRGNSSERGGTDRAPLLPANLKMTPASRKGGREHLPIGTHKAKDDLMRLATIPSPGPGSIVYAAHLGRDYYEGLLSETLVEVAPGDRRWKRISRRETGEELDCLVYAYAAERYEGRLNQRFGRQVDVIDPAAQEAARLAKVAIEKAAQAVKDGKVPEPVPERLVAAMTSVPAMTQTRMRRASSSDAGLPSAEVSVRVERARRRASRGGLGW